MNWPLFSVIYSMAATVTVGMFMIGALVTGFNEIHHIQIAVAIGIVFSIPAGLFFTKKISSITGNEEGYEA
ncbi:MAG: hypothetical protein ACTH7W_02875 [Psychrobacter sp.]|uniref:hypothetical protein n=1 Tax=unclassified Psychrobacter TaxID=196806 RepID=UPI0017889454|nr:MULTISPECIES: hypothetical protein [unclassified Psychrobacter]MBE0442053.1 hypothetical protein [Psychrobacter sp. FME13]